MIFIDTNCLASEKGSYKDKGSLNSAIAELYIPFYDSVINKVIGKITDRDEVIPILEFVTLKSKM